MSSWNGGWIFKHHPPGHFPGDPVTSCDGSAPVGTSAPWKEHFPYGWVLGCSGLIPWWGSILIRFMYGYVWYIHLHMMYFVKCRFLTPFETYDIVKIGLPPDSRGANSTRNHTNLHPCAASTSGSGLNFSAGPQIWISPAEVCWNDEVWYGPLARSWNSWVLLALIWRKHVCTI